MSVLLRAKNHIIKIYNILKAYLYSIAVWSEPDIKFVIFAQGRTGSTLLVELLNQIEEIHCEEEIYNKDFFVFKQKIPFPYIYLLGKSRLSKSKVFGFKVKIYQLYDHQNLNPLTFLKALSLLKYLNDAEPVVL